MSSTSRPEPKRIRSDQDHSKKETKDREDKRQKSEKGDEKKEDNEDVEWLSEAPFNQGKSWDGWTTAWRQSCWCGKTAFAYNADPLQAKICHCEDCQRLHGAPFQHAAVFKKDMVRLDCDPEWLGFLSAHGEVHPLSETPTPIPHKVSCRACGTPLFDQGKNMIMAFPPTFEWPRTQKEIEGGESDGNGKEGGSNEGGEKEGNEGHKRKEKFTQAGLPEVFKPQSHIFYERRVVDVIDGTIKWRGHKDTEEMGETER